MVLRIHNGREVLTDLYNLADQTSGPGSMDAVEWERGWKLTVACISSATAPVPAISIGQCIFC